MGEGILVKINKCLFWVNELVFLILVMVQVYIHNSFLFTTTEWKQYFFCLHHNIYVVLSCNEYWSTLLSQSGCVRMGRLLLNLVCLERSGLELA